MDNTRNFDLWPPRDSHELARHLAGATIGGRGSDRVSVGILVGNERFFASKGDHGVVTSTGDDPIVLGCLTKVFTATLVAEVIARHSTSPQHDAATLLEQSDSCAPSLRRIRLHDLLNHTHGLDASLLQTLPRRADGFIDPRALWEALSAVPQLSAPGELYSYGNAGAWLSAAILEQLTRRKYYELFLERLVQPLGLTSVRNLDVDTCPARGNRITMSIYDVLTFLHLHLRHDGARIDHSPHFSANLASMRSDPFPLPGWSPSECASCEGWKSYGSECFGHNAISHRYLALVRIHPATQTAIVFAGGSYTTFVRLFSSVLPEFRNLRPPRLLPAEALTTLDIERYTGTYRTGALALKIGRIDTTLTCDLTPMAKHPRAHSGESTPLIAASDDVFFPRVSCGPELPYLQFIVPRNDEKFEYLWNGKYVWRRSETTHGGRDNAFR